MDVLGLVDLPVWLIGTVLTILSISMYSRYKQTYFTRHGLAQKSTRFFIGDLYEVATKGFGYFDVSDVKKYGKIFGRYIGNVPHLVVSDAEIAKTVFVKQFSNFAVRDFFPTTGRWKGTLVGAVGGHWKFLRAAISPTFSSGKLRQMNYHISQCLSKLHGNLEQKIETNEDFDIAPMIGGYTLDVVCSTSFGIDVNSQQEADNQVLAHAKEAFNFQGGSNVPFIVYTLFPDFPVLQKVFGHVKVIPEKTYNFFSGLTKSAIEERRQSNVTHKDLLQLLINAHKEEPAKKEGVSPEKGSTYEDFKKRGFTDEQVLMNSLVFIAAGYDTTLTTLSWLVYELAVNQDVQNKLRETIDRHIGKDDPKYDTVFTLTYLDMVVKETLRLHSPVPNIQRCANEDTVVCGIEIPKGMVVFFHPDMLHFMEEYWENPHDFVPERFAPENKHNINEYAYMPFGLGPRNCVGMRLALLEVKITLVSILQKYIIHRSDKLKVPMLPAAIGLLRKPNDPVYVRVERRKE